MKQMKSRGASGCPREQLKATEARPLQVVRFREASAPEAQSITNSLTEAAKNLELDLTNILNFVKPSDINLQLENRNHRCKPEAHH